MKPNTFTRTGHTIKPAVRFPMLKELYSITGYTSLLPDATWTDKFIRLVKIYCCVFIISLAIGYLIQLVDFFLVHFLHHKSIYNVIKYNFRQLYKKLGPGLFVGIICFLGPLFEEIIFRLPLSFKKRYVFIGLIVAVAYSSTLFIKGSAVVIATIIQLEIIVLIIALILCWRLVPNTIIKISKRYKNLFIILSIILFGSMHLINYKPLDITIIWIYPIFILPQLLIGVCITYTRLKNGFWWGLALHCICNTVFILFYHF